MLQLSICMMVKNEEGNLTRCLKSLDNIRSQIENELIIVDTGSTDGTVDIAKQYTDKIYFHQWKNNFAEMRNTSISYAKGTWVFIIDADEELCNDQGLIDFIKGNNKHFMGAVLKLVNIVDKSGRKGSTLTTLRLFKNNKELRYEGAVHNVPIVKGEAFEVASSLIHYGYITDDDALMTKKFERTSALLIDELSKDPENIYYRFQLATTYDMHKDYDLAKLEYEKTYLLVKLKAKNYFEYLYLWGPYTKTLLLCKDYLRAIEIGLEGLEIESDYVDVVYFLGMAYVGISNYEKGIEYYERYLELLLNVDELPITRNPAVQLYTLSLEAECRHNIAQAYMATNALAKSKDHAKWLMDNHSEDADYFVRGLNIYIEACVKLELVDEIQGLYSKYPVARWSSLDNILYSRIRTNSIFEEQKMLFSRGIAQLPSYLGEVYKQRLTPLELRSLNFNALIYSEMINAYCDEALILAFENGEDISEIISSIKEIDLMTMISNADEKYVNFEKIAEGYIIHIEEKQSINNTNLKRIINKYLMIKKFSTESYITFMSKYFECGVSLLEYKYSKAFLNELKMFEFLNSEEQMFALVRSYVYEKNIKLTYFIDTAATIFPDWKIQILNWLDFKLKEEQDGNNFKIKERVMSTEEEELKNELIKNIDFLIENGHLYEAEELIVEYSKINENDQDIIMRSAKIKNITGKSFQ